MQIPSLDEHMNHKRPTHVQARAYWTKDVSVRTMDVIKNILVVYDIIFPDKLQTLLSKASFLASPLHTCCTPSTNPFTCCIRHRSQARHVPGTKITSSTSSPVYGHA